MQVRWKTDGAQHNHNDFRFSPLSKTSFLITVRYDHALQSVLYTYTYTYTYLVYAVLGLAGHSTLERRPRHMHM